MNWRRRVEAQFQPVWAELKAMNAVRVSWKSKCWLAGFCTNRVVVCMRAESQRALSVILGLAVLLSASPLVSQANATPPVASQPAAAVSLMMGKMLAAEISAHSKRYFTIAACAGCFVEVRMEQEDEWMPVATLAGPGIATFVARSCDAGIHSVVRIPFFAPQAADYTLEVHIATAAAATVHLTLTVRPEEPTDHDAMAAYDAMALAEQLRHKTETETAPKAIAAYDQVIELARRTGDQSLEQQALVGKARVDLYRTGDYIAGLKIAQQAIALIGNESGAPSLDQVAIDAATWKVLSSAYSFLARYPEMIDATRRSLALYASLGDLYWQGILEGNAANVYLETGDMQHALASAEEGLDIARRLSDADGISFTLATIAMIHDLRGEYQAAIDASEEALEEIRRNPYPDEEGQVWAVLGGLYDELNDPERERDALNRALPLLRQSGDTANQSMAFGELALLDMRQGRLHDAIQAQQQAMEIARSHHLAREQASAFLSQAILDDRDGQRSRALAAIHDGLALARKTGELSTAAMLSQEQGDLLAHRGNTESALAAYRNAENSWSLIPNLEDAALARASIARVEWESRNSAVAERDILEALDGFEASRKRIGGRSLRESYFASVHDFYDLAIEIAMSGSTAKTTKGQSKEDAAVESWSIAERARAQSLMDSIRESSAFSTRAVPQSLLDRSADVEKRIGGTQQTLLRLSATAGDRAALADVKGKLHSLVLEADEIEARERAASSASLFSAAWKLPSMDSVRGQLLDPETALLEYWMGKNSTYLWVVTAQSVEVLRVSSSSAVISAVAAFQKSLLAPEENFANESLAARDERIARAGRELENYAATLGRLLLPSLLPARIHRLILVPDGVLASVPFAALRVGRQRKYLIENYELIEEPSASVAMELLSRSPSGLQGKRIAVYADPIYNRLDPRLVSVLADSQAVRVTAHSIPMSRDNKQQTLPILRSDADLDLSALPRLHGSEAEAQAISSIAGPNRVTLYTGFRATPAQVMQTRWNAFAIAHFAAHAIVDPDRPELSGIVLTTFREDGSRDDGVLWLHDVYRTPMPVPLVVLSGCRTASGMAIPGEGITGLAQAFLSAGASTVVGSLWSVDDAVASKMIPRFYQALLQQNQSVAGALRMAQLQMLANGRPPYDWAGYIVEGNTRTETTSYDSSRIP